MQKLIFLLLQSSRQLRDERRLRKKNIITQQCSRAPRERKKKKSHKNITFTASMTILTFHTENINHKID